MRTLHLVGLVALLGAPGCYREYASDSTMPMAPEPVSVAGPPGGEIDPGYAYQAPGQPGYPAGYPEGYAGGYPQGYPSGDTNGYAETPVDPYAQPQVDPGAAGDPTGTVTDDEINQTLQPYGQWVEDEEYGRVWRPDPTVVGVNFTPYETAGSWVNTDAGWAFDCEWDWGWLPFHYGNWEWFDDYWGWVPDYTWAPAQVEWRSGGGYVGWRPLGPRVRDHRHGGGPIVRDHRHGRRDSQWRFATETNFGKPNIRAHIFQNPAEGLRVTSTVTRPPVRPVGPTVHPTNVMHGRLNVIGTRSPGVRNPYSGPTRTYQPPTGATYQGPQRTSQFGQPFGPQRTYQPPTGATYQPPTRTYQPPTGATYQPPTRTYQPPTGATYQPPTRTYQPPTGATYQPPTRTYQPPYTPPTRTYQPPTRTYQPPTRSTYSPPSRSTYSPPSRSSYSPPSRSTYSPPSRSSYSPPSRSSYSAPSRSSSSSSSSSHSSSSSSHSSSSSSSSHSSGGSHRR